MLTDSPLLVGPISRRLRTPHVRDKRRWSVSTNVSDEPSRHLG